MTTDRPKQQPDILSQVWTFNRQPDEVVFVLAVRSGTSHSTPGSANTTE